MVDSAYKVYLDLVKEYLEAHKRRLLTEEEEAIVINHLEGVALAYKNDPENSVRTATRNGVERVGSTGDKKRLGITQVLSIETAKKISEIHPDFPTPTKEQIGRRVAEVLAFQNYLKSEKEVPEKLSEKRKTSGNKGSEEE